MKKFLEKHHQDDRWVFNLQNLLTAHFEKKSTRLNTGVLDPIGKLENFELWKIYMSVGGVRKNQSPRVCFSKNEMDIIFFCFGTHIQNYKTSELIQIGKERLKEIIMFSQENSCKSKNAA